MQLTYGLHACSQYTSSHMYMCAPLLPDDPPDMKLDPLPELPPETGLMQGVPLIDAGTHGQQLQRCPQSFGALAHIGCPGFHMQLAYGLHA